MKINFKRLLIFFVITFVVGGLAGFITRGSMDMYDMVLKPALAPPPILFPIVWTILYALMAISAYIISVSDCENKGEALKSYFIQLALNFVWPIIFFNFQAFLVAFVWILILWVAIIDMIRKFYVCSKLASYLQLPYLLWVTFAAYLNIMIYILNR